MKFSNNRTRICKESNLKVKTINKEIREKHVCSIAQGLPVEKFFPTIKEKKNKANKIIEGIYQHTLFNKHIN